MDQIRRYWMNNGVVIHNPRTVFIGDEVILESDVEIGQNTILRGKTHVERGSTIGPGCLLENCRICNDALLEGYNILVNAHIPEHHIVAFGEQGIEEAEYE
jgi:bifunctional UDP-N-acetylglucosamine pyrophosphorylase/glucosamine-1-phosphate N-acetyltransferase